MGSKSKAEAESTPEENVSRFPEVNSLSQWLESLTPSWAPFKASDMTHADGSVLMKIVMMGMVEKRTSTILSQPGSPVRLRVIYDASGFDRLPDFFRRDIFPLVPEWNPTAGILNHPDDAFSARLTTLGETEKRVLVDLATASEAGAEVNEETAGIDLLDSIRGDLSLIAEYAPRRYARLVDYSRVGDDIVGKVKSPADPASAVEAVAGRRNARWVKAHVLLDNESDADTWDAAKRRQKAAEWNSQYGIELTASKLGELIRGRRKRSKNDD